MFQQSYKNLEKIFENILQEVIIFREIFQIGTCENFGLNF